MYPVLESQLEFVWKMIEVLYSPFQKSFVAIFDQFLSFWPHPGRLATVPMGCKLLDNVVHSGHRNMKISGDEP